MYIYTPQFPRGLLVSPKEKPSILIVRVVKETQSNYFSITATGSIHTRDVNSRVFFRDVPNHVFAIRAETEYSAKKAESAETHTLPNISGITVKIYYP